MANIDNFFRSIFEYYITKMQTVNFIYHSYKYLTVLCALGKRQ